MFNIRIDWIFTYEMIFLQFSGDIVPIGGTKPGSRHNLPIIPGDTFVEPLSGRLVRVQSGYLIEANVLPSGGGFQALLDSSVLACEARVIDTLRELKDAVGGKIIAALSQIMEYYLTLVVTDYLIGLKISIYHIKNFA